MQALDRGKLMDRIPLSLVGCPEKWRCCTVGGRGATGASVTGCTVRHNIVLGQTEELTLTVRIVFVFVLLSFPTANAIKLEQLHNLLFCCCYSQIKMYWQTLHIRNNLLKLCQIWYVDRYKTIKANVTSVGLIAIYCALETYVLLLVRNVLYYMHTSFPRFFGNNKIQV